MTADTEAERVPASRPHLGGIESLRAYAALSIVVFHVIHLAHFDPPQSLMALKWHLGRGVPLFFVVSAFSLAYGYFGRLATTDQLRDFYLRRFFRIAPLFYLASAIQLALNYPHNWVFAHPGELFLNLAFLFNLSPANVEGIALASWSIGVEMLFYAILPLLLLVVRGVTSAVIFATLSSAAAVIYMSILAANPAVPPAFVQHGFLFNLPYFAFGLLAFFVWRSASPRAWAAALGLSIIGMLGLIWAVTPFAMRIQAPMGNAIYQTLWGLPFGLLCLALAWRDGPPLSWSLTYFLGRISFSLYLVHPHVIDLLGRLGLYAKISALPGGSLVQFPAACLLTIGVLTPLAYGFYRLVEVPGIALGRRAVIRLRQPRSPPR